MSAGQDQRRRGVSTVDDMVPLNIVLSAREIPAVYCFVPIKKREVFLIDTIPTRTPKCWRLPREN